MVAGHASKGNAAVIDAVDRLAVRMTSNDVKSMEQTQNRRNAPTNRVAEGIRCSARGHITSSTRTTPWPEVPSTRMVHRPSRTTPFKKKYTPTGARATRPAGAHDHMRSQPDVYTLEHRSEGRGWCIWALVPTMVSTICSLTRWQCRSTLL